MLGLGVSVEFQAAVASLGGRTAPGDALQGGGSNTRRKNIFVDKRGRTGKKCAG